MRPHRPSLAPAALLPPLLFLLLVAAAHTAPARAHGASRGMHLHLRPDPAERGSVVAVEVTAAEDLTGISVSFAGHGPVGTPIATPVRRLTVELEVPRDHASETLSCQAEARTVSGNTLRASAVLRLTRPGADPCGPAAIARPPELPDLVRQALVTLTGAGHAPAAYDLRLRRERDLRSDLPADTRLRRSVIFVPRDDPERYALRVDAASPCVLRWEQETGTLTDWQRRLLARARDEAAGRWPDAAATPAGIRDFEVLESRDLVSVRWQAAGEGEPERSITLRKADLAAADGR